MHKGRPPSATLAKEGAASGCRPFVEPFVDGSGSGGKQAAGLKQQASSINLQALRHSILDDGKIMKSGFLRPVVSNERISSWPMLA